MDPREQADEIILAGAIFFSGSEYRVDQVVANAGLALLDLEAVGEEVQPFAFADRQPQDVFRHDVDDAQSGPAERDRENGRASCRENACQSGFILLVSASVNKTHPYI